MQVIKVIALSARANKSGRQKDCRRRSARHTPHFASTAHQALSSMSNLNDGKTLLLTQVIYFLKSMFEEYINRRVYIS